MHHMSCCHGFSWFSFSRRRTVSRDSPACSVRFTISPASNSRVHRARPSGGLEQAVAISSASSLPVSFPGARARLFTQRQLDVTFDEPTLGPVDRSLPDADAGGNHRVAHAAVSGEQDLCPFQFPSGVLAATQHLAELISLGLAQRHAISYIHRRPPRLRARHMNHRFEPRLAQPQSRFTAKQGQYLAFIHAYTLVMGRPPVHADLLRHF